MMPKPDLTCTKYSSDWKIIIERFAGGAYTVRMIELLGGGAEIHCQHVFGSEDAADASAKFFIRFNPDGMIDQVPPGWTIAGTPAVFREEAIVTDPVVLYDPIDGAITDSQLTRICEEAAANHQEK